MSVQAASGPAAAGRKAAAQKRSPLAFLQSAVFATGRHANGAAPDRGTANFTAPMDSSSVTRSRSTIRSSTFASPFPGTQAWNASPHSGSRFFGATAVFPTTVPSTTTTT